MCLRANRLSLAAAVSTLLPISLQTLWCGNVVHDQYMQVTSKGVRLIDCSTSELITEWAPQGGSVVLAAASASQVRQPS